MICAYVSKSESVLCSSIKNCWIIVNMLFAALSSSSFEDFGNSFSRASFNAFFLASFVFSTHFKASTRDLACFFSTLLILTDCFSIPSFLLFSYHAEKP